MVRRKKALLWEKIVVQSTKIAESFLLTAFYLCANKAKAFLSLKNLWVFAL